MNFLQSFASGLTGLIAPDLQSAEQQAQLAAQQLQLAFEVIIAEGAIIAGLLLLQVYLMTRKA